MLGKNIKYYRQLAHLSQDELAQRMGVQKMTISNYENDKRLPDSAGLQKMAVVLGIKSMDLIARPHDTLQIHHGAFRKQSAMGKTAQELLMESIERYLARFYNIVSILGSAVLAAPPQITQVPFTDNESGGRYLRSMLHLPVSGPVGNIVDILENNGFIICQMAVDNPHFSGINGIVEGRPYIMVNTNMPAERQRFTLIHELAHIAFDIPENEEKVVNGIAGAFLLPKDDAIRELGPSRHEIRQDLRLIQREYGIAMSSIAIRALQADIITQQVYTATQMWLSQCGLRKDEQSGLEAEKSNLFEQLVIRAVLEDEIGIQKGAELLQKPYNDVHTLCYGEA